MASRPEAPPPQGQSPAAAIRVLRVIVFALMAGLLLFLVVAPAARPMGDGPPADLSALLIAALGVVAIGIALAYFALRRALTASFARRTMELRQVSDPSRLLIEPYRRFVIIGAMLLDALGVIGFLTYLVTGHPAGLMAIAIAVVMLALHVPSADKLQALAADAARSS